MKKPDLGRYREAVYGCSSFITTFGFEKSDRSQNEEDEFLACRPNGLLICYTKKFLPLLWLSCDVNKLCNDSVENVSKYQSMYHLEKKELPSWTAILRGWTDLKVKHSDETFVTSEPVMAFSKADRQYALISDAATGMVDTPGGLGAILTQVDKEWNFYAISFASRQLKDHEKNYSPFLLEAAAAVWCKDFFNEFLKGKRFI